MAIQIKKYKPEQQYIKAMIAWDTWAGKTTFASTACRPLFLCTENWLLSIADKQPDMIEIKSVQDLREAYKFLETEHPEEYDTIVVDSLSEMANTIKNRLTNYWQTPMSMRDWWTLWDTLMWIFSKIISLPYHILFLTHTQEEVDEETGKKYINIALSWRSKNEVLRAFDVIGYLSLDSDWNRYINVRENNYSKAKCRSQALKAVDALPLNFCERVDIVNKWTNFGKSEVVKEIKGLPDAPTPAVQEMREKVEKKLLEDRSDEAKSKLKEWAMWSQKIWKDEKTWICQMIDLFE